MSKEIGKARDGAKIREAQTAKAGADAASGKPGERVPPAKLRAASVKAAPEAEKTSGIGGLPSPVGDNDLA